MTLRIFKASVHEVSRSNRFLVWVPGLPIDLIFHCINVNIPGEAFSTNQSYDPQVGTNVIPWELPYDLTQNECQMTFMLDPFYRLKTYFDDWRKEIYDPAVGFGYMADYAKPIKIMQLTRQHIPSYTMTLEDAWPKSISDVNFDASAQNAWSGFTVGFVYGGTQKTDTLGAIVGAIKKLI